MGQIKKETSEYILYSPESLNYIVDSMQDILSNSIKSYKQFFGVEEFRQIQINFFDDIDEFRNYIYELRGEKISLPEYAKGTFDKGMINSFIENNLIIGSYMYNRRLYMASHELFHIMYKELIWEKEKKPRITWFDEGMAQFFSGEYNNELSDDNFDSWFKWVIDRTKEIPNLNDLNHRNGFETEKYSGYKLSLLAVKYLYETLSLKDFKELIHNTDDIIKYGDNVLNDAIDYYNKKLIKQVI